MLTEVIAYGAGAREAALDDETLMSKLGEARHHLAAPFAAERVDLVAGVAETLLGPRRSTATGPAAHFAFWTRRAALTKLAASFAARVPNCLTASVAASVATVAVRCTREVGIFSLSRAMPAGPHTLRATWDPGTMSSEPSLQRTQAFLPPS